MYPQLRLVLKAAGQRLRDIRCVCSEANGSTPGCHKYGPLCDRQKKRLQKAIEHVRRTSG